MIARWWMMTGPALVAAIAVAATPADQAGNPLIDALARCLTIREDAARLACTDIAAARLVEANRRRDVVVVDREDIRKSRRSLFGLEGATVDPFAKAGRAVEQIDHLDTTLVTTRAVGGGRWVVTLAEGGRWETTEAWEVLADPKAGTVVTVRRAALGSYVMRVAGQRSVRVKRAL